MENVQAPRGTRDIFGDTYNNFETIDRAFRRLAKSYGFRGLETPIFEALKVFNRTLGESSDIVSKEMYAFKDRGGDDLCLRPEGTAGAVRAFLENSWQRELPMKLFYSGPMFRYERPQKGRYRQFYQLGVEILGVENSLADAEVIGLGLSLLEALGVSKKCQLEINSLGDKDSRELYRAALVAYYEQNHQKLSEISKERLKTNPLRILDSKDEKDIEVNLNAPKLSAYLNAESQQKFERAQKLLQAESIEFNLNDKLVRGLDYYNDLVFEFKTLELGSQDAVLSGGRYDNLVETMGGPAVPGCGFGAGIDRLALLMDTVTSSPFDIVFIPMSEAAEETAIGLSRQLRSEGFRVEFVYSGNFSKRMKKAARLAPQYVGILADKEIQTKRLGLKNMATGEQVDVDFVELANVLRDKA